MFWGSRNPLLIFLQSYHVWVTSKIQVDFRFNTYSEVNVFYRYLKFLDYSCFGGQGIHCWYFYRATMFGWPRNFKVDFRFNTYSEVLVIVSCRGLKFPHYLCFWGQGILCWHSYWATMFRGPRKFRSPSGSRGFRNHPNIRFLDKNALNL